MQSDSRTNWSKWKFWENLVVDTYDYLPFGAGPRTCVGGTFAAQAIRLALAVLLQRFHVELGDGAVVSRKCQGITMGTRYGLPMRLVRTVEKVEVPARVAGDIHDLVDLSASA